MFLLIPQHLADQDCRSYVACTTSSPSDITKHCGLQCQMIRLPFFFTSYMKEITKCGDNDARIFSHLPEETQESHEELGNAHSFPPVFILYSYFESLSDIRKLSSLKKIIHHLPCSFKKQFSSHSERNVNFHC